MIPPCLLQLKGASPTSLHGQGRTISNIPPKPSVGSSGVTGIRSPCPYVCRWGGGRLWANLGSAYTGLHHGGGLNPWAPHKGFLQRVGKATFSSLCSAPTNGIVSSGDKLSGGAIHSSLDTHTCSSLFFRASLLGHALQWSLSCPSPGPAEIWDDWQTVGFGGPAGGSSSFWGSSAYWCGIHEIYITQGSTLHPGHVNRQIRCQGQRVPPTHPAAHGEGGLPQFPPFLTWHSPQYSAPEEPKVLEWGAAPKGSVLLGAGWFLNFYCHTDFCLTGRKQEPRPSLAARRFEKQSRPSSVAVFQTANDTKGDNQGARLPFSSTFCQWIWSVLLNYFSLTIRFGRYREAKTRLRLLFFFFFLSLFPSFWLRVCLLGWVGLLKL